MDRIGYVILFVADLEPSIAFYRDVLGLPYRFTDAGYAEFGTTGIRFALYERHRCGVADGAVGEVGPSRRDRPHGR